MLTDNQLIELVIGYAINGNKNPFSGVTPDLRSDKNFPVSCHTVLTQTSVCVSVTPNCEA